MEAAGFVREHDRKAGASEVLPRLRVARDEKEPRDVLGFVGDILGDDGAAVPLRRGGRSDGSAVRIAAPDDLAHCPGGILDDLGTELRILAKESAALLERNRV